MGDIILKVENVSKQYRLGTLGTGSISHDLNRVWHTVRGKEDPYLKIGESNDRSTKGTSEYVWALRDISFEAKRGEVLGIIGKNGAGKSTLLKILSKVTGPTTGSIKYNGRIASLLEVGTGFHPEMTGKENIFLNGAILGMTKIEINSKLDEIIVFSGCERYIDTPVKRYSSGMRVRLAFAVAAFLEPDILIVDEVLAVGDAEFQKKAIGKMQDISSQGGRTVLFVSHDMVAIQKICNRVVILKNGMILKDGSPVKMITEYLSVTKVKLDNPTFRKLDIKEIFPKIIKCFLYNSERNLQSKFNAADSITLVTKIENNSTLSNRFSFLWMLQDKADTTIAASSSAIMEKLFFDETTKTVSCTIDSSSLIPGEYKFKLFLHVPKQEPLDIWEEAISFEIVVHDINNVGYNYGTNWNPQMYLAHRWNK